MSADAARRRRLGTALGVTLALAAAVVALAFAAVRPRDQRIVFEDERHFLSGAANLALHRRLAFAPPSAETPAAGLLREPGYPAVIALAWRAFGVAPAATTDALGGLFATGELYRPIRVLHLVLLALAAAASGWAVLLLRGPLAGAIAAALVAASPALQQATTEVMSEILFATLLAALAAALVALATRPSRPAFVALLLVSAVLPLVRAEALLLLALGLLAAVRVGGALAARRGYLPALLFLCLAPAPALLWMARNRAQTGQFALSDRGGLALAVREALDADIVRFGARTALWSFTPSDLARERARKLDRFATFLDHRPSGSENFLLRTYRRFDAERGKPGADPIEVDARLGREALRRILARPGAHAAAGIVVAWRGLFAERSPGWTEPWDLALPLGLLLAAGFLTAFVASYARGEPALRAALAPALLLALFHSLATEFLPRYSIPLLPIAWSALVLAGFSIRKRTAPAGDA